MKTELGFTLIELMVTITVGAILLSLAVPSFTTIIKNERLVSQTNDLVATLNYARGEAIKQDAPVTVTANGGNWANGWTVCCASGGAPANTVLQVSSALASGNTLSMSAGASLTFAANGNLSPFAGVTFTLCDSRGATQARDIEVDSIGRIEASQKQGYTIGNPGTALVCP